MNGPRSIVKRDATGKILPGQSLNPGGRPAWAREYKYWLLENALEPAKRALLEMLASDDMRAKAFAIKEINDRLFGKAPQPLTGEDGQPLTFGVVFLPTLELESGTETVADAIEVATVTESE